MEAGTYVFLSTQEAPSSFLEEVVRIFVDCLHDRLPVEIDRSLGEGNVDGTTGVTGMSKAETMD